MNYSISRIAFIGAVFASQVYGASFAYSSCLSELRRNEITERLSHLEQQLPYSKKRSYQIYYPEGFKEGEERNVVVYMPGFASGADAYTKKKADTLSVQEKISKIYKEKGLKEPVVVSFSMGAQILAGVDGHGDNHPTFLPTKDYWQALEEVLADLPVKRTRLSFFANSAGAWNTFQMLRSIPDGVEVSSAVLIAMPNFTTGGLGKNPALLGDGTNVDPHGTALRSQLEPMINSLLKDPLIDSLLPNSALYDSSLPRNTRILIQGADSDALGYSALNENFVSNAREQGYPIEMLSVPGGHADGIDNEATVRFLERVNP
ncbi:MAG: hypothetical protein R3A80_12055 [Bdellovibrionota bacterium]